MWSRDWDNCLHSKQTNKHRYIHFREVFKSCNSPEGGHSNQRCVYKSKIKVDHFFFIIPWKSTRMSFFRILVLLWTRTVQVVRKPCGTFVHVGGPPRLNCTFVCPPPLLESKFQREPRQTNVFLPSEQKTLVPWVFVEVRFYCSVMNHVFFLSVMIGTSNYNLELFPAMILWSPSWIETINQFLALLLLQDHITNLHKCKVTDSRTCQLLLLLMMSRYFLLTLLTDLLILPDLKI